MDVPVARPPWSGVGKRLESSVRKALFDFRLLEDADGVAVALSGGKDSMALLFFLRAILGRGFPDIPLVAVHVNGDFSCGAGVQLDFLQRTCDALAVPLHVRSSAQSLDTLECYSCSRQRRRLLFDAAKGAGVTTVAFGHHRDDNAQTLLMNLLHKGELAGNLPKLKMVDYGITIIRPLIYVAEADIITFAQQHNFMRIMCRCPVGQNSMRKQVNTLLSQIELLYPNARENISSAALNYGSDKAIRKSF